jgi:hypothetical protein
MEAELSVLVEHTGISFLKATNPRHDLPPEMLQAVTHIDAG